MKHGITVLFDDSDQSFLYSLQGCKLEEGIDLLRCFIESLADHREEDDEYEGVTLQRVWESPSLFSAQPQCLC